MYGANMNVCGSSTAPQSITAQPVQGAVRLGKNIGAYHGEPIDIDAVLNQDLKAARRHGWTIDTVLPDAPFPLYAFSRRSHNPRRRVYISTGIHGDEPAGPLAIRQLLQDNAWPTDCDLWVMPCLNPQAFVLKQRTNADGIDLNRDYRQPRSQTVRAHVQWLEAQPRFDYAICLHEDWEAHGFYLYELNPERQPSFAEAVIATVAKFCPIDLSSTIDGWPAHHGIIRPQVMPEERPEWAEAIHLIVHKTHHSYTLEAPSDFELSLRTKVTVIALQALLLCRDQDRVD